jgi:glycosyltransferase involved in cell wall biosynthesis
LEFPLKQKNILLLIVTLFLIRLKPKVLFVLHLPPPMHGAALVGSLIKSSDKINEQFQSEFINLSASNHLIEIGKFNFHKLYRIFKVQCSVLKKLIFNRYELCYITLTSSGLGFYKDVCIVALVKLFRIKIVYHFHNKGVSKQSKNILNDFLFSFVFKNTDTILLSDFLYYDIKQYVDHSNVRICHNGILGADRIQERLEDVNSDVCKLLFLSNMMKEKGVIELLNASVELKKRGLNFECHFAGNWMDITEDFFQDFVLKNDLTNYVFAHGKVVGPEKIKLFNNSDIFVFPTYYDCFPLALLEAMDFSLPIISTFEGGIQDIVIDNYNGLLVNQKDTDALIEKISFLITQPELRIAMGNNGNKLFNEKFTIQNFEEKFSHIIMELASK